MSRANSFCERSQLPATPATHRLRRPTLIPEMSFMVGRRVLPSKTKTTSLLPPFDMAGPSPFTPHMPAPFSACCGPPPCPLLPLHHRAQPPFWFFFYNLFVDVQVFVCVTKTRDFAKKEKESLVFGLVCGS